MSAQLLTTQTHEFRILRSNIFAETKKSDLDQGEKKNSDPQHCHNTITATLPSLVNRFESSWSDPEYPVVGQGALCNAVKCCFSDSVLYFVYSLFVFKKCFISSHKILKILRQRNEERERGFMWKEFTKGEISWADKEQLAHNQEKRILVVSILWFSESFYKFLDFNLIQTSGPDSWLCFDTLPNQIGIHVI